MSFDPSLSAVLLEREEAGARELLSKGVSLVIMSNRQGSESTPED